MIPIKNNKSKVVKHFKKIIFWTTTIPNFIIIIYKHVFGKIELDNIFLPSPRSFASKGCYHMTRWCAGAPLLSLPSWNLLNIFCCISRNVKAIFVMGLWFLHQTFIGCIKGKLGVPWVFQCIFFYKNLTRVGFNTLLMCVVLKIWDLDFCIPPLSCFEGN